MRVLVHLAVGAQVEEAARGVVGSRRKGIAIGEELHSVDVALVAGEGLHRLARPDVPHLGHRVARARHKGIRVGRQRNAHDVAGVVVELHGSNASLNVPEHTRHVTRRGQNLSVIEEPTAREIACMRAELASDLGRAFSGSQVVDGADVVETTAGHKVTRWSVRASHDPRRAKWDGMHLVGGVGVPDDELSILRGGDEVPLVVGPVHGVDFGQVAFQLTSHFEDDAW